MPKQKTKNKLARENYNNRLFKFVLCFKSELIQQKEKVAP